MTFPVTWRKKINTPSTTLTIIPYRLPCPTGTPFHPCGGFSGQMTTMTTTIVPLRQPSLWTVHYPRSFLTNGSSSKMQPSCPLLSEIFSDLPQMDGLAALSLCHSATGESSSVCCLASRRGLWTNSTAITWGLMRNADSHFTPNLQNQNLHLNKISR